MAHTVRNKDKLIRRVRRVIGQTEAVQRALEEDAECGEIMQLIITVRGAINSLMGELVEDHIREHMIDPKRRPTSSEARAANELIDVVKRYTR